MQDCSKEISPKDDRQEIGANMVEYVLLLLLVLVGALIAVRAFSVSVSDKFSEIVSGVV